MNASAEPQLIVNSSCCFTGSEICSLIGDFGFNDGVVSFLALVGFFLGVCTGEVELEEFCNNPSFEFEFCWLTGVVELLELNRTHSRDIPIAIHFLNRQC